MQIKKFDKVKYDNGYAKEHFDCVMIEVKKGNREILRKYAEEHGTNMNAVMISALEKEYGINLQK